MVIEGGEAPHSPNATVAPLTATPRARTVPPHTRNVTHVHTSLHKFGVYQREGADKCGTRLRIMGSELRDDIGGGKHRTRKTQLLHR